MRSMCRLWSSRKIWAKRRWRCGRLSISGVNVTCCRTKAAIIPRFLDELDSSAKQVGAVNVPSLQKNGKLHGHNTDGSGFLLSLQKDGHFDPAGKKSRHPEAPAARASAAAMALAGAGVRRLVIANRNKTRAEILAKRVQRNFDRETLPVALDEIAGALLAHPRVGSSW